MPDIGFYHPILIHLAIGLLAAGVLFRWMSLTGRAAFAGPAATSLTLLATVAILVAAQSGEDAHVAVEAVPGAARAVRAHQQWGERTRNLALAVGALELLALALHGRPGPTPEEPRLRFRRGWLTADALDALGHQPEARAVLERLRVEFPENARLRGRLARAEASRNTNKQP